MSGGKKIKIAFLWHMHQPFYLNPETNKFSMPWVRLHALKDYLDMPVTASRHGIKATFNLVPSLIDQLELYGQGVTDRHLDLTRIPAKELSDLEKVEILETFFSANVPTMIEPFARYRQLYRKKENCGADLKLAVSTFSTSEWRDLQIWSNLVWIDPMFRKESPIRELFGRGRDFREEDKLAMLDYQLELIKRIIPTYKELYEQGKIDISLTPYYHPIIPLLIDTDAARESMPDIILPQHRFTHPEDAEWHVENSRMMFERLFGGELTGMWPSEGSVSEEALKLFKSKDIRWVATDEGVLRQSLTKSGIVAREFSPHYAYEYECSPGVKLFFRDHGLSDKIGFVYSGWEADRAVHDFIYNLMQLRNHLESDLDDCVVPIILDGENAWEYFPDDATKFLNLLYERLNEHNQIEVISFGEAASQIKARKLPRLFAGSWINHNFRIWIGHHEDNSAWDLLSEARQTLVKYQNENPGADKDLLERAWKQIYVAEGSDWCWWYGDDHLGNFNNEFDELFRHHLIGMYKILGLQPPAIFFRPIHEGKTESFVTLPEALITPELDGQLTHFYEWSGCGVYDCDKAGGAMHRVKIVVKSIYFAYDYDNLYIRLDFKNNFDLVGISELKIKFDFGENGSREVLLEKDNLHEDDFCRYFYSRIFEISFPRKNLLKSGSGLIKFFVSIITGKNLIEKWPIDEPITLELPEKDKEIFWQV